MRAILTNSNHGRTLLMTNATQETKATHASALALMASLAGITENEDWPAAWSARYYRPGMTVTRWTNFPRCFVRPWQKAWAKSGPRRTATTLGCRPRAAGIYRQRAVRLS